MNRLVETTGLTGIAYKLYNNQSIIRTISIESYKKKIDDYTYIILIDSNGNCIRTAYDYLNTHKNNALGNKDMQLREQAVTALKLLYSYMELKHINNIEFITDDEINEFKAFIRGQKIIGTEITFEGTTIRSNTTINTYQYHYRKYLKFLGVSESVFYEERLLSSYRGSGSGFLSHAIRNNIKKYVNSEKTYTKRETPKYISYREYLLITELIDNEYSIRDYLIVILMYNYGLRIGEVLGLTIEDLEEAHDDSFDCRLILRNRSGDRRYQHAKSCINVKSVQDYSSKEYNQKNVGYQVVELDREDFDMINDYLNASRSPLAYRRKDRKKSLVLNNLDNKNIADKVTNRKDLKKNSYIFISKNGTPLTGGSWNRICRKIFETIGIDVDKDSKRDNLNHRFRHGFAMFKVIVQNYDILQLQNAMRHSDPTTCKIYFNVDEKEKGRFAHETQNLLKKGDITFE